METGPTANNSHDAERSRGRVMTCTNAEGRVNLEDSTGKVEFIRDLTSKMSFKLGKEWSHLRLSKRQPPQARPTTLPR